MIVSITNQLFTGLIGYFRELHTLLPKAARFAWLLYKGTLVTVLFVPFGTFMLTLYAWGEANWDSKLRFWQKVLFWVAMLPLSLLHIFLAAHIGLMIGT